jgi:hypothetical protein
VWDIYRQAITDITLPSSDLSQREQETLKNAENFLREEVTITDPFTNEVTKEIAPTGPSKAYDSLFAAYAAAVKAYNNSRITAVSDPTSEHIQDFTNNGPIYEQLVRNAYSQWGTLGYRDYVQKANGIISALTARGPYALYERLRADFALAERKDLFGNSFYPTFAYPPKVVGPEFDSSWTRFSFVSNEISQFSSASSTSWGGGVRASYGLWSVGGGSQYSNSQSRSTCDTNGLSLTAKLIQVPLIRPWWNAWIFSSRGWKGGSTIGDVGSISSGITPLKGFMPVIPTSMILAKDVQVGINMTSEENKAFKSQVSSSASVGWGPFSVRGNYSRSDSSSSHEYTSSDSGIEIKGAQIIGFICDVLPLSPNPDPALPFPPAINLIDIDETLADVDSASRWLSGL